MLRSRALVWCRLLLHLVIPVRTIDVRFRRMLTVLFAAHLTPVRRGRTVLRLWGYDATYIEPWVTARREIGDTEQRASQTHATAADAAAWLAQEPGRFMHPASTVPAVELVEQALEWASLDLSSGVPEVRKHVGPQHEELGGLCGPWLLRRTLGSRLTLDEPLRAVRRHVRAAALEAKATVTWGQPTEDGELDCGLLVGTGWTGTVLLSADQAGGTIAVDIETAPSGGHDSTR